jgi:hypothetical protein
VSERYGKVVVTSGHMIDSPDRDAPRFPSRLEPSVAARIEQVFDKWGIGPGDLVISGGARGADTLFAESAHRRGADVEIVLALPPDEFEKTSVALPDSVWPERFRYLLRQYPPRDAPSGVGDESHNEFAAANAAMIRRAEALVPPAELRIALVWDEQPAGGPGGTGDFADLARRFHAPLAIINPTNL